MPKQALAWRSRQDLTHCPAARAAGITEILQRRLAAKAKNSRIPYSCKKLKARAHNMPPLLTLLSIFLAMAHKGFNPLIAVQIAPQGKAALMMGV